LKIEMFWVVTPSKLVKSYRRLGGVQYFNTHGQVVKADHYSYIE